MPPFPTPRRARARPPDVSMPWCHGAEQLAPALLPAFGVEAHPGLLSKPCSGLNDCPSTQLELPRRGTWKQPPWQQPEIIISKNGMNIFTNIRLGVFQMQLYHLFKLLIDRDAYLSYLKPEEPTIICCYLKHKVFEVFDYYWSLLDNNFNYLKINYLIFYQYIVISSIFKSVIDAIQFTIMFTYFNYLKIHYLISYLWTIIWHYLNYLKINYSIPFYLIIIW